MAEYRNPLQYGEQTFEWDPTQQVFSGGIQANAPGYLTELLGYRDRLRQGQTMPWEAEQYAAWEAAARAIPTRDIASLTSGWQGELAGQWGEGGWQGGNPDWWTSLDPGSPDSGGVMLAIRDRMDAGTATPQERALYGQTLAMAQDWNTRASVPQASDLNPFGMGDQFMQALSMLTAATGGAGAFGAFGAGALGGAGAAGAGAGAAGAAPAAPSLLGVPLSTLSTIGQMGSYGGMGAGILGSATDQDWLSQLGMALGVTGGVAGGLAGLGGVLNSGVNNLTDAARLASSAGRMVGAGGRATGYGPLQQAASWLGRAGQLGNVGAQVLPGSVTDWSGRDAFANVQAQTATGDTAQDWRTQRGGGNVSEWDWLNLNTDPNYGGDMGGAGVWAGGSGGFDESGGGYASPIGPGLGWDAGGYPTGAPGSGLSLEEQVRQGIAGRPDLYGSAASPGGWGTSVLGALGAAGSFLGRNASWLGPAASALGGLGAGAVGANASRDASAAQANALNRGIDLQTAQWLQQQANQAPWLQAGMGALPQLQQRAGQGALQPFSPTAVINPADYTPGLPGATPGWSPQTMDANAYRWTPGQGPRAADYRYTPGQTPDAAAYRSGPPQLYQGAMPGTQVPTLTGQQVLEQDPGAAFRQTEARKALEASALARGSGMSGSTLAALQRQSQDLASQEYGNAWQRMMARDTEQYGRNWNQYQQQWNQGVQGTQLGLQTNAQNFGQALSAAQLREQVNQVASQQGWSQAQAEAAFREQMAQLSSQQGFSQALQGQTWNQGQAQQWDQERYQRLLAQNQLQYGRDQTYNQTLNERAVQGYNSQQQQQATDWNRWAALAGYGPQAAQQLQAGGQASQTQLNSLLSQLGTAQGMGDLGSALSWQRGIGGATNNLTSILSGLNR